jgi:putative transposase
MNLFDKPGDFEAFAKLLDEACQRFGMRILAWCLMHNHWHLVLWPRRDGDLSRFMQWLGTTHVRRWRQHRRNVGEGHLYQGRFKSFVVQADEHLLVLIRYIEANPLRARLVRRAQDWLWSSLNESGRARLQLAACPVDRTQDWARVVNEAIEPRELERVRTSLQRGRPMGSDRWAKRVAAKLGMISTLRDPWRPKNARKLKRSQPRGAQK